MTENVTPVNGQAVCLNLSAGTLLRGNQPLYLRSKTFAVLQYFVERPGQLVTKDAILDDVWPDVVVSDTVLGVCVHELRRALGDTAKQPQWIETVYKRGYRYIGNLEVVRGSPREPVVTASEAYSTANANTQNNEVASGKSRLSPKFNSSGLQLRRCESTLRVDALPKILTLPHLRNTHFTGRACLLASIHETLTSGQRTTPIQAINGLGGVGKTQLAVEYAYRYARCYDAILWVGGDSPTTLLTQYIRLAQYLKLPETEAADYNVIVTVVRLWFEQHSKWLLIFDNVEDPELVRPYLPRAATGHVLVTSRNPSWFGLANVLKVPPLERTEAAAFLQRRTMQRDAQAANMLADALGNLPLALEQAGAYIDTTGITLAGYYERFTSSSHELLQRGRASTGYPSSVATTWALAFEQVQLASQLAEQLLNLCAFLAADEISRDLLRNGLHCLRGTPVSLVALDDAIATLRYHSLVDVGPTTVSVHRLVQTVTRQRLQATERQAAIACAVSAIHKLLSPVQSSRDAATCVRLLPHAVQVASYAKELPEEAKHARRELGLLLAIGQVLTAVKGYTASEVKTTYGRAWSLAKKLESSELDLQALQGLTVYHITCAELEEAQEVTERRIAIAESLGDRAHSLHAQYHLGQIVFHRGFFSRALTHFEEVIEQYELLPNELSAPPHGIVHPAVASFSYAAWSLWVLGFATQAIQQIQRALELARRLGHPFSLAFALLYKCGVHQLRGEVIATQECTETLIDLADKQSFPFWSALGRMMRGWALTSQSQYEVGIPELREGLVVYKQLGAELTQPHWLGLLADAYGRTGQAEEGLAVIDEAMELATITAEHCYISALHRLRGELVRRSSPDRSTEAVTCFSRAITTAREQGAKSLELQATVSLCRLWRQRGEQSKVCEILAPLYEGFTEGFDTVHFRNAKGLLEGG